MQAQCTPAAALLSQLNDHQYVMRSEVRTGPFRTGTLLSTVDGWSGEPMRHRFRLAVP